MKNDESYNNSITSSALPAGIEFRLAESIHQTAINDMMLERNPTASREDIIKKTNREIELNKSDPFYWLYIAKVDSEVVGFCRFFHSQGMPQEKKRYPAPEGWYGMGILVKKEWRRKNIARFLSKERIKRLKELKADTLYSVVDVNNLTSRKMHAQFGFIKMKEAKGFLHLEFETNGILYRRDF